MSIDDVIIMVSGGKDSAQNYSIMQNRNLAPYMHMISIFTITVDKGAIKLL